MILITVLGLDQYVIGRFSKTASDEIQKIIKNEDEEIFFLAPESFLFHKGVEQTSWHAVSVITLPSKYQKYEKEIAELFLDITKDFVMNMTTRFEYDDSKQYVRNSPDYPRFIEQDHIINDEDDYFGDEEEYVEPDENTLYLGNVFKDYDFETGEYKKSADQTAKKPKFEVCEGDECASEQQCECEDGDKNCNCKEEGHHHHRKNDED